MNVKSGPCLFWFFFFWLHYASYGILVPWPGLEPVFPAVEVWHSNSWTTRKVYPLLCKYTHIARAHSLMYIGVYVCVCVCARTLSHLSRVQCLATLWTVACQSPLSMGFSRQEYWSGLPCPPPGDLPNPRMEHSSPVSPNIADEFFTTEPLRKPNVC